MSSVQFTLLEATKPFPGLGKEEKVSEEVLDYVKSQMTGTALADCLSHFTVGKFYIGVALLEQHSTQRDIDSAHVEKLVEDFGSSVIQRSQYPGVVIGLGDGWHELANTGSQTYKITINSTLY